MSTPGFAFPDAAAAEQLSGAASVAMSVGTMSLVAFAGKSKVDRPVVDGMLAALDADETLLADDFAFLQNDDVLTALDKMKVNDVDANAIHKAQAMRLYRSVQKSAVEGGAPLPGVSLVKVEPPSNTKENGGEAASSSGPLLLRYSSYLNQAAEGTFPLLTPSTLKEFREEYVNVVGTPPNPSERPTDEQLSALSAMIRTGRAPFADFAVFGAFDEHSARLRKFTDQVFVGGVLQTRLLHGPANFEDWKACWGVFKAAMVMLKAARIGPLNSYEEGIRQLVVTYSEWAVVSQADVQMRSVEWNIVQDELGLQAQARPWDEVMKGTAFGNVAGPRAHWWWTHVVGPLSKGSLRGSAAVNVVESLEQRPGSGPIEPVSKAAKRTNNQRSSNTNSRSQEVCYPWNEGSCSAPCPNGRQHRCRYCGATNHRGFECTQKPAKGKGKGSKNGKGDGKGGDKGGDKNNDQGGRKRKRGGRSNKSTK